VCAVLCCAVRACDVWWHAQGVVDRLYQHYENIRPDLHVRLTDLPLSDRCVCGVVWANVMRRLPARTAFAIYAKTSSARSSRWAASSHAARRCSHRHAMTTCVLTTSHVTRAVAIGQVRLRQVSQRAWTILCHTSARACARASARERERD
jgi:hypothetical protein